MIANYSYIVYFMNNLHWIDFIVASAIICKYIFLDTKDDDNLYTKVSRLAYSYTDNNLHMSLEKLASYIGSSEMLWN